MNSLHLVSSVRCLACGTVYPKPSALGTAESNPGCPRCGYVGWVPADQEREDDGEVMEAPGQLRSFADLPLRRFWQAG
jgi:predicted  nucleic acid-binding Zn-ribbon protein